MSARWYLIRHVPDLRRREPHNVGLVLRTPDGWMTKFIGQNEAGDIDGRQLPHSRINSTEVYKTWVRYFQRKANDKFWPSVFRAQKQRSANYIAEEGGELLEGSPSWREAFERLFSELVAPEVISSRLVVPASRPIDHLQIRARAILDEARIVPEDRVQVDAQFYRDGRVGKVPFRFKYVNGRAHLMDFGHQHVKTEHAAADARELRARVDAARLAGSAVSFVTFYASSLLDPNDLDQILLPLDEVSFPVDVDKQLEAVEAMAEIMGH